MCACACACVRVMYLLPQGCRWLLGVHSVLEVHQLACGTCVEADKTIPSVPELRRQSPDARVQSPESSCLLLLLVMAGLRRSLLSSACSSGSGVGVISSFCDITSWL